MAYSPQIWTNNDPTTPLNGPRLTKIETALAGTVNDKGATGWRNLVRPAFIPLRTVNVTTVGQLNTAISGLTAGDYVVVQPGVYSGSITTVGAVLSAPGAVIEFLPGALLYDSGTYEFTLFLIRGASNIQIYGGELVNPSGPGTRIISCSNVTWWGFTIHDCGETGLYCGCDGIINVNNSTGMDLDGEVYHCGQDATQDPHAEVGSGMHCTYIGGGGTQTTSGKFSVYVHDQPTGAGMNLGGFAANAEFWIKAERITFNALSQSAGNAVEMFGSNSNITIHHITAKDCAGLCVSASANMPTTTVEYALADNCLIGARQTENMPTPFETTAGITYSHTQVLSRASNPVVPHAPGFATANAGIVNVTASGVPSTAALTPTFYPITSPSALYLLSNLAVNITATVAASTVGIAIYKVEYNPNLAATRILQLDAAISGSATTGVVNGIITEGAAGGGAPPYKGSYLDFTAHQYVVGVMTSTTTTLALAGVNPPAGVGAFRWSTTARSTTTDWPSSFTSSSVSAISTSRVDWVGLLNADGLNWY